MWGSWYKMKHLELVTVAGRNVQAGLERRINQASACWATAPDGNVKFITEAVLIRKAPYFAVNSSTPPVILQMHGRWRRWDIAQCLSFAQTPGACGVCIDVDLTVIDVVAAVRVQYDKAVGGGPARAAVWSRNSLVPKEKKSGGALWRRGSASS